MIVLIINISEYRTCVLISHLDGNKINIQFILSFKADESIKILLIIRIAQIKCLMVYK